MPGARMDVGDRIGGKGVGPGRRPLIGRRRSRRSRLALIAVLAIMVPLLTASGASAKVPRSFFGVVPWLSFQGQDYQRLAQAKVHNARTPFFWPSIEPSRGDYQWAATDNFVGQLAFFHVRVLPFLNGSPSWVASDVRRPPLRSKRTKKAWRKFVKACVNRYGPHGKYWRAHPGIPKVPITTWQVWNEQNNSKYFAPRPKPKKYAKLLKLTHRAVKSRDHHAKIVLGGMFGKPEPKHSMKASKFLGKLYKSKRIKHSFNIVAVHPYAPTVRNLKRQMSSLHKVIKRHHDNAKMWVTEMGWGSAPRSKKSQLLKGVQGQKKMLKKSFHLLIRHRKGWHLKRVYWFLWRDAAPDAQVNCSFCSSAGLFTYDFHPKPSWNAFLKITHR
jgi:polysaccharide biosynthesis protein PslG